MGTYIKYTRVEELIAYVQTLYRTMLSKVTIDSGSIVFSGLMEQEESKILAPLSFRLADFETRKAS
jgi:hypothetical protein